MNFWGTVPDFKFLTHTHKSPCNTSKDEYLDPIMMKRLFKFFSLIQVFLVASVTHAQNHAQFHPQSGAGPTLSDFFFQLPSRLKSNPITAQECVSQLELLTTQITHLRPSQYSAKEIATVADDGIHFSFEARIEIRNQMRKLYLQGQLSEECVRAERRTLRTLRGLEDYIGMIGYRSEKSKMAALYAPEVAPDRGGVQYGVQSDAPRLDALRVARPLLSPSALIPEPDFPTARGFYGPHFLPRGTLVNPQAQSFSELRSGDVLLSRGNANVSALIARMADEDTQFSHIAMVYIDPDTQKAYTIESHIEHGSIILPLEDWLKDGKLRTAIFRQRNRRLAEVAAIAMYNRVKTEMDRSAPIKYDFAFEMNDHERLFCSEVVREGYEEASNGQVMVPAYPSRFTMKNRDLFDRMGIRTQESFLPEDIEVDPRFEMVAEWRNFATLSSAVRKDAILTAVYAWMENRGYHFDPGAWYTVEARIGKLLRQFGFYKDKMPTYMEQEAIELSIMIDDLVSEIEKKIATKERAHEARTGMGFSYFELIGEIESVRLKTEGTQKGYDRYFHANRSRN